ncbi:MAG: cation:dicarboxylase symporter family transporter, partial [Gemmatimonadaceae bacterium]
MADTTVDARRNQVTRSRILLGLGVGTLVGVLANVVLGAAHPLVAGANHYVAGPVGQIFLRLLLVIVMPLMFASVTLGVAGMDDLRRVGRVGARALAYFAVSTGVAATLGLVAVVLLRPGERIPPETRSQLMVTYASDASARVESAGLSTFGVDRVASIIPGNVFRAAIDLDVFAVLVFAVLFGVALSRLTGERAKPMTDLLQSVH